jgi:phospholipid/cholesterol/gamma-HCH transport system substrate-binding protein
MLSSRMVGAGAFIVVGVTLFAVALFMIGERRMLFQRQFPVHAEFAQLGQLEIGAIVRVAGMDAGEVTSIEIPASPSGKFRVRMDIREDLHQLVRTDSVATTQTEGLVGAIAVNIAAGTEEAAVVSPGGTIRSREPIAFTDLLRQASTTITLVNDTVEALRGDIEGAIQQLALTAEQTRVLMDEVGLEIRAVAANGRRISGDAREIVARINAGEGTIGKLIHDDALYQRARELATQTEAVMANLRQASDEARRTLADFRSTDGPAQGLMTDMRVTLEHAREATADLADNMEALKHNFFLRGFFNRRGYFDLDAISPNEYRKGVLENGKRKALRIWLTAGVLFDRDASGTEVLSDGGRARIDSAVSTYLEYLPSNPLMIEGYASGPTEAERFRLSRQRAAIVREYLRTRYELAPQDTGFIGLGREAPGSPDEGKWEGVSLALFLDRDRLRFAGEATAR